MNIKINDLMQQSGVKFGTSGARGLAVEMTDQVCYAYTKGFLQYLEHTGSLKKNGELVEFKQLYDNQIPAFVKEQVVAAGFRMTEAAMAEFSRRSGTNLQEIVGELEKLLQYVGDSQVVDVDFNEVAHAALGCELLEVDGGPAPNRKAQAECDRLNAQEEKND